MMKNNKAKRMSFTVAAVVSFAAGAQAADVVLDMTSNGAAGQALDGPAAGSVYTVNNVTVDGSFSAPAANPVGQGSSTQFGVKSDASNNSTIDPSETATFALTWDAGDVQSVRLKEVVFTGFYSNDDLDVTVGSTVKAGFTYNASDPELSTISGATRRWTPAVPISITSGQLFEVATQSGSAGATGVGIQSWTLEVIAAGAGATTNLLQQWTFNHPDGTQLTALTNTVAVGGNWNIDQAHMATSNNVLHVKDASAYTSVQAPLNGVTNGVYELSWTFAEVDLTSPDSGANILQFTLDEIPSQNELLNITLNYTSSNGKLFLKAANSGTLATVADLGTVRLLTNVAVRAVFDLDADTYDVFVNNNGAGENLVANGFAMIDGELDMIRMKGAMHKIGATGFVDIEDLTLVEIVGGEAGPETVVTVLNLKNQPGDTAGADLAGQGFTIFTNVTLTAEGASVTTGSVYSGYSAMGVFAEDDQFKTNEYPGASTTGWDEIEQALDESITYTSTFNTNLVTSLTLKQVVFVDVGTSGDRVVVAVNGVTNYVDSNIWNADIQLNSGDTITFSAEGAFGMVGMTFETTHGEATTPTQKYSLWISDYTVGAENGLEDDPDGDLLDNLTEYAWGGEPDNGSDQGNTPVNSQMADGGTNYLEYVYYEREDAVDRGLFSRIEVGTDLVITNWGVNTPEFVGSGASSIEGYLAVTNRIPTDSDDIQFIRLQLELAE